MATASHDSSFRVHLKHIPKHTTYTSFLQLQVTIAEDSIPLLPPPLPALWNPPGILWEDAGSILPEGTGSFLPASLWHPPTILVASSQHPPPLSRSIQVHLTPILITQSSHLIFNFCSYIPQMMFQLIIQFRRSLHHYGKVYFKYMKLNTLLLLYLYCTAYTCPHTIRGRFPCNCH